jgi:hypothetical protein
MGVVWAISALVGVLAAMVLVVELLSMLVESMLGGSYRS